MLSQIFRRLRGGDAPENSVATPSPAFRCPSCLSRIATADLEWRCPSACPLQAGPVGFCSPGGPQLIAAPEEQSSPCPVPGCIVVHSQPWRRECDRPLEHRLHARDSDVHHVLATALDNDKSALTHARAGLLLAPELSAGNGTVPVHPADIPSRRLLDRKDRVRRLGLPLGGGLGSVGVRLAGSERRLYVHHVLCARAEEVRAENSVGECPHARMPIARRLARADTLALAVTTDAALRRRDGLGQMAEVLAHAIRDETPAALPSLLVLIADESVLAERMGETFLPGLVEARGPERIAVLEGYVLHGLQLAELLAPLLALPWRRILPGTVRLPLSGAESVAGLGPWLDILWDRRP